MTIKNSIEQTDKLLWEIYNSLLDEKEPFSIYKEQYETKLENDRGVIISAYGIVNITDIIYDIEKYWDISIKDYKRLIYKLQNSKDYIRKIIKDESVNIKFCNKDLINDESFIKELVWINWFILKYLPQYSGNKEVVKIACLKINWPECEDWESHFEENPFKYASFDLKFDKEYVKELLSKNAYVYRYIGDKLKDSKEILMHTINNKQIFLLENTYYLPCLLDLISDRLKNDKEVVLACHRIQWYYYEYDYTKLDPNNKDDIFIIYTALTTFNRDYDFIDVDYLYELYKTLPEGFREHKELFEKFYQLNGWVIEKVSDKLKLNDETILKRYNEYCEKWNIAT